MTGIEVPDRLLELLTDEALAGVSVAEQAELDDLIARQSEYERDEFALAAAALHSALIDPEPMPAALRLRVLENAERWARDGRRSDAHSGVVATIGPSRLGWLAAAACLILAALAWWPGDEAAPPGPTVRRSALLEAAPDAREVAWQPWDDPEQPDVDGDVVWSEREQRGFMRFRGLGVNDPAAEQYQLWIIDERGMAQRISGGVFDADPCGELIVPIEPAVRIRGAVAFAVTIERPGGVWVSDMSRRVVIAPLPG